MLYKNREYYVIVNCSNCSRYQKTLEDQFRREFVGRSLHDTVYLLLLLRETKLADKLRTEYRVTDRR
jgi:hypothetical protein